MLLLSGRSRRLIARLGRWLAEVLVVFVGVYAAFWLDGYRAERRTEQRRQQIYEALYADVSRMSVGMEEQVPAFDSLLVESFMVPYEDGEQPMPEPFFFMGDNFNTGMWEAMLQSGGLDALDIGLVQEVDDFYKGLNNASRIFKEYEQLSNDMILPRMDEGVEAFYDLETQRFKKPYQWYPRSLRRMSSMMKGTQQANDSLLSKLEARMEEGE